MRGGRAEGSNKPVKFAWNALELTDIHRSIFYTHIALLNWVLGWFGGGTELGYDVQAWEH